MIEVKPHRIQQKESDQLKIYIMSSNLSEICRSRLRCQDDATWWNLIQVHLHWKQVNLSHLIGRFFFKRDYQRPVEIYSLFLELPLTPAFIQLSACCCLNNGVWHVQSGMCLWQFQVALCWFHQPNQVQLWLRLTGHMSDVDASQSSAHFLESLFNLPVIYPGKASRIPQASTVPWFHSFRAADSDPAAAAARCHSKTSETSLKETDESLQCG